MVWITKYRVNVAVQKGLKYGKGIVQRAYELCGRSEYSYEELSALSAILRYVATECKSHGYDIMAEISVDNSRIPGSYDSIKQTVELFLYIRNNGGIEYKMMYESPEYKRRSELSSGWYEIIYRDYLGEIKRQKDSEASVIGAIKMLMDGLKTEDSVQEVLDYAYTLNESRYDRYREEQRAYIDEKVKEYGNPTLCD